MDVGGAKIVVVVVVDGGHGDHGRMAVPWMVRGRGVAQQPRAEEIDAEAEHRHRDRLAIGDRNRVKQPHRAFIGDLDRDQARMIALENAARSPNLPVPKAKRELRACWRANR